MDHQLHNRQQQGDANRQKRDLNLAQLIAQFRQARGLSQNQLAQASRLSRTYIYHLEQAQRTHPSLDAQDSDHAGEGKLQRLDGLLSA